MTLLFSVAQARPELAHLPWKQLLFAFLGLICQIVLASQPLSRWLKLGPWALGLAWLSLLVTALAGVEVNGARRWLALPGIGLFQPSEFAKWSLFVCQLGLLARGRWLMALAMALPTMALVMAQPDLGTASCFAASSAGLLYLVGCSRKAMLAGGLAGLAAASLTLRDYQKTRLLIFLHPESDPEGAGWNLIQSKIAVGSGGLHGLGLFQGLHKRLMYVPEQHTDFLFTVLAEEGGWLGGSLLLLLFGLLLARAFRLARKAERPLQQWLCAGVAWTLGWQTLVNLGMVVGLLPVTGIPLPWLSYGGSALLTQCAFLGLLQGEAVRQRGLQGLEGRPVRLSRSL